MRNISHLSLAEQLTITEQDENYEEETVDKATGSNAAHRLDGRVHHFVPVLTGQDLQSALSC